MLYICVATMFMCSYLYHIVQNFDGEKLDEFDNRLPIC